MQYSIENDILRLTVDSHGAEPVSVIHKPTGAELLWQADPAVWNRHAPILFPYTGKLTGGKMIAKGKEYAGGQHGFAAGRGLAVMVAGLQRDHQGALGGIDALTLRVAQALHLGMGLPGGMMPAARHHLTVAHQHGAHGGVGAGAPAAVLGQGQGLTHEGGKNVLRHAAVL